MPTGLRWSRCRQQQHDRIVAAPAENGHSEFKALRCFYGMTNGKSPRNPVDLPRLDETDRKIIGELVSDGRVSLAELGRRVSLSSPAVADRVQRLERAG